MLLLGLVVAGLLPLLATSDEAYQEAWRRQEMVRNVQLVLDQLARDFARASAVQQAWGGTLRLEVPTEGRFQVVEFALQPGGDLAYRVDDSLPQPLAGPFASFQLRCFDSAGSWVPCGDVASVRQVEVELEATDPDPDPVRGPVPSVQVTARAARRVP